jgi:hypothetical protein
MRTRSILTLLGVLSVFLAAETWMFLDRYWFPIELQSASATIVGTVVDVGSPVMGRIEEVYVFDAQRVRAGDRLLLITPQSQDRPFGGVPLEITAPRAGTLARVRAVPGSTVQASETLAQVIDLSPESLYVDAVFPVDPANYFRIRALLPARVSARYFRSADPIAAVVTAVEPVYDATESAVRARVRITGTYPSAAPLAAGLPVQVAVTIENDNPVKQRLERIARRLVPSSLAR